MLDFNKHATACIIAKGTGWFSSKQWAMLPSTAFLVSILILWTGSQSVNSLAIIPAFSKVQCSLIPSGLDTLRHVMKGLHYWSGCWLLLVLFAGQLSLWSSKQILAFYFTNNHITFMTNKTCLWGWKCQSHVLFKEGELQLQANRRASSLQWPI